MRTRWRVGLVMVGLLSLCPLGAYGESALPWIFHSGATATGNGVEIQADYFSTVVVQIEGTFVGTVTFEKKTQSATGYVAFQCTNVTTGDRATDTETPGYWECPGAASRIRARVSAYTSGTIVVTGHGTTAVSSRGGSGGTVAGLSAVLAIDRIDGDAINQASALRVGSSAADAYFVTYYDSTDGLIHTCLVGGILDNCNKTITLSATKRLSVLNASKAPIFEVLESGAINNATLDCEASGNTCTLYQRFCGGDLVAVDPSTGVAAHIWDKSPLDTAPAATTVTGTNQTYGVARFPDVDGNHGVELSCLLPLGWTGNVDVVVWGKTAGTGNLRLQLATKCYGTDETPDAAFNTASIYTLAAGTSGELNRYSLTNLTMTGCAASELLFLRAFRNRTEGSDTLNNTFDVKSISLWARSTY